MARVLKVRHAITNPTTGPTKMGKENLAVHMLFLLNRKRRSQGQWRRLNEDLKPVFWETYDDFNYSIDEAVLETGDELRRQSGRTWSQLQSIRSINDRTTASLARTVTPTCQKLSSWCAQDDHFEWCAQGDHLEYCLNSSLTAKTKAMKVFNKKKFSKRTK